MNIIQLDNSKDGSVLIGHSLLGKKVEVRIYKDDKIFATFESDVKLSGIKIQRGFFSDTDTYEMKIFYAGQLVDSQIFQVIDYDEDFCFSPAPASESGTDLEDLGNLLNLKQNKVIESGTYKGQEIETVIDKLQPKTNQEGKTIDERFEEVNKDLNEKQSKVLEDGTTIQENLDNLQDDLNSKVSNMTFEEQNEIFAEDIETAFDKIETKQDEVLSSGQTVEQEIENLKNRPSGGTQLKPYTEAKIDELYDNYTEGMGKTYKKYKYYDDSSYNNTDDTGEDVDFFTRNKLYIPQITDFIDLYISSTNSEGKTIFEANSILAQYFYTLPDQSSIKTIIETFIVTYKELNPNGGFASFIFKNNPIVDINLPINIVDGNQTFKLNIIPNKQQDYIMITLWINTNREISNVITSQSFNAYSDLVSRTQEDDADISIGFKTKDTLKNVLTEELKDTYVNKYDLDFVNDKIDSLSSVMETTQVKQININPLEFAKNSIVKNETTGHFEFIAPYYQPGDDLLSSGLRLLDIVGDKGDIIEYYKNNLNTTGSKMVVLFGNSSLDYNIIDESYPIDLNDTDNFGEYLISVPKGSSQIRAFMYINGRLHVSPILEPIDENQSPLQYPIVPHTWTFEKAYNRDIYNYLLNFLEEAHQNNPVLKEFIKSLSTPGTSMKYITEAQNDVTAADTLLIGKSLNGKQYYGQEAGGAQSYGQMAQGSQSYGLQAHGNQSYGKGAGGAISFGEASWVNVDAKSAAVEHFFGKQLKTEYVGGKTYFATSTDGENWTKTTHTADELIKHLDTLITS